MSSQSPTHYSRVHSELPNLNLTELDSLMEEILHLRKKLLPNTLSETETELIEKINNPIPKNIQEQYDFLITKKNAQNLNQIELNELIELANYVEHQDNKRLERIIELSKLRNEQLDTTISQLGVNHRADG